MERLSEKLTALRALFAPNEQALDIGQKLRVRDILKLAIDDARTLEAAKTERDELLAMAQDFDALENLYVKRAQEGPPDELDGLLSIASDVRRQAWRDKLAASAAPVADTNVVTFPIAPRRTAIVKGGGVA